MNKGTGSAIIVVVVVIAVLAINSLLGVTQNNNNGINQVEAPNVIQPMNPIMVQENTDGTTTIVVSIPIADVNATSSKANERNLGGYAEVISAEAEKIEAQGDADSGRLSSGFLWLIGIVCLVAVMSMGKNKDYIQ